MSSDDLARSNQDHQLEEILGTEISSSLGATRVSRTHFKPGVSLGNAWA